MSTLSNARDACHGDATRSIAWLTFSAAFAFGLVALAVVREARSTTDAGLPVAARRDPHGASRSRATRFVGLTKLSAATSSTSISPM